MAKRNPITLNTLPVADLAYATGRLIPSGKTTEAEVVCLTAERVRRHDLISAGAEDVGFLPPDPERTFHRLPGGAR